MHGVECRGASEGSENSSDDSDCSQDVLGAEEVGESRR